MQSRRSILFLIFTLLTLFLFLLDLSVGAVDIPLRDVCMALTGGDCPESTAKIILNIRLIKAVVALCAGAALSVSGLQMQTLFRNPLAPICVGYQFGRKSWRGFDGDGRCQFSFRHSRGCMGRGRACARSDSGCGSQDKRHHGDSYPRHDVFFWGERGGADTPVSQQ